MRIAFAASAEQESIPIFALCRISHKSSSQRHADRASQRCEEKPGSNVTTVTAYNQETRQYDGNAGVEDPRDDVDGERPLSRAVQRRQQLRFPKDARL